MPKSELGIRGKLPPFRLNRGDFIKFISGLSQSFEKIRTVNLTIENLSFSSSSLQEIDTFLQDLHIPSVISRMGMWIHGTPTLNLDSDEESANYWIVNANSMEQAVRIKDLIETFFNKHKAPAYYAHSMTIWLFTLWLGLFELIIGLLGIIKKTIPFPYLHIFVSLLSFALYGYISLSQFLNKPKSFSFVYSLIYMEEPTKGKLWTFIVGTIVLEIIVYILIELILTP